jgi:hypothetical protein
LHATIVAIVKRKRNVSGSGISGHGVPLDFSDWVHYDAMHPVAPEPLSSWLTMPLLSSLYFHDEIDCFQIVVALESLFHRRRSRLDREI